MSMCVPCRCCCFSFCFVLLSFCMQSFCFEVSIKHRIKIQYCRIYPFRHFSFAFCHRIGIEQEMVCGSVLVEKQTKCNEYIIHLFAVGSTNTHTQLVHKKFHVVRFVYHHRFRLLSYGPLFFV